MDFQDRDTNKGQVRLFNLAMAAGFSCSVSGLTRCPDSLTYFVINPDFTTYNHNFFFLRKNTTIFVTIPLP